MTSLVERAQAIIRARRTVRARLSLLYAVMFLGSGLVLLAIPAGFVHGSSSARAAVPGPGGGPSRGTVIAIAQHSTDVHNLIIGSAIALVLLVLVSLVLGWLLAGRLLRPLRTITDAAREISASNLHQRLGLTGPDDEFKELGNTLDDLFARLEASFTSQRRFVANASHELRTPLTAERTLLQVALADPEADTPSLRAACEAVLRLGVRQERLIDALLTLAAGERGLERRQPCDLSVLARAVLDDRRAELESRQLHVYSALSAAPVAGDARLLESLVSNLVDNAIQHNTRGGRIDVTTATLAEGAAFSVHNTGPLIAAEDVDRLFRPFQRLGVDRVGHDHGHGLGLTIVQAIVTAHGATVDASARIDGGLDVDVTFPTAPPLSG